jgi:5-methylthioadenosine/S-adenosylhomocysteine deaminase
MTDTFDLLLANGLVVTLQPDQQPISNGFVAVSDGAVAAVGSMSELKGRNASRMLDVGGNLIMPGLVNTHCHMPMTVFRGMADDLPLDKWLNEHMFPAESKYVDEDLVYWGSLLACAEMLLSGTTTVADGYFFEHHAARAVKDAGMRAVLAQGVLDFPVPGVHDPAGNIDAARAFIEQWQNESPLIRPSVFCHSPYTCSAETLTKGKDLARQYDVLFQIHVSETAQEVDQSLQEKGKRPVHYLDELGILDSSTLVVHGTNLDESEIDVLAERGAPVAVCVESNMKLASGMVKAVEMLKRGVTLGLGTDGAASNNNLNLFGEIRHLALAAKAYTLDPTVIPAHTIMTLAGPGGAKAIGLENSTGVITPGARADIIELEIRQPHLQPLYNPVSHLAYAASGREVKTVLVDGEVVVENGRITTFDVASAMAHVRKIAGNIGQKG